MFQILNTATALSTELELELVLPRYHRELDLEVLAQDYDLPFVPPIRFLTNFGFRRPGLVPFALFNLPAIAILLKEKWRGNLSFIYLRSSLFLPLTLVAYLLRVPCFYEIHRRPVSRSEGVRDYCLSRLSSGLIVISDYLKEYYSLYRKNILVVHDAVSLRRFARSLTRMEARQRLGWESGKKICLYAGTISRLKGADYLVAAARLLPEVEFDLLGPVASEFSDLSWPANVKLLGKKDQQELPLILQAADVLLLPHPRNEYSQSPMKLFEYLASGVPMVASRLPSLTEILNYRNAVLVEPEDGVALADGIRRVLVDPVLSRALAEQAFQDVQGYTWEMRGKKIADFIRHAIC